MFSFEPLKMLLNRLKMTEYDLVKHGIVSCKTYTTLKKGMDTPIKEGLTIKSLNSLCSYFNCQIEDIMEYIPDDT